MGGAVRRMRKRQGGELQEKNGGIGVGGWVGGVVRGGREWLGGRVGRVTAGGEGGAVGA